MVNKNFANIKLNDNEFIIDNKRHLKGQSERVIFLHSNKSDELGILRGDFIKLKLEKKGKSKQLICSVDTDDNIASPTIMLTNVFIRKNLRAKIGDKITFEKFDEVDNQIDSINLLPFKDCVENMTGDLNVILARYFENKGLIPFTLGEKITINDAFKKYEFKVVNMKKRDEQQDLNVEPTYTELTHGVYTNNTIVSSLGDPLDREKEDDPNFIGYDDIGGCGKQIELFRENVELPLIYPNLFETIGVKPSKGVLLHGPPGTGKTLLARATSYELGVHYISQNGPVGCPKELEAIFDEANEKAPCIIFFDEIDALIPNRDKSKDPNDKKIVAKMLSLMDGIKSNRQVMVVGATNRPNDIDPAFRRPGRFDQEIEIGVPDELGRLEILAIHTKNMKLDDNVDINKLANETHGFVGADLNKLCRDSAVHCIKSNALGIELDKAYVDIEFMNSLYVKQEHFDKTMETIKPSSLRETFVEYPKITWNDIGGLDQVKKEFYETLELPLLQPELFKEFGLKAFRGILMFGPPGCGKTQIAKAAANGCGANFISIKSPDIFDKYVGESESRIRDIFAKANAAAPCILFFDEIDAITRPRGNGNDAGVGDRVMNQLLAEMDGFGLKKNVYVIGATNRPDNIDPAILRPGRFDKLVYVPPPDNMSRLAILQTNLKNSPMSQDVLLEQIAKYTDGYSGADMESIAKNAIKNALLDKLKLINELTLLNQNTDDVPSLITRKHFEKAVSMSKKSISGVDMAKYEEMRKKYCNIEDPTEDTGKLTNTFKFVDENVADIADDF